MAAARSRRSAAWCVTLNGSIDLSEAEMGKPAGRRRLDAGKQRQSARFRSDLAPAQSVNHAIRATPIARGQWASRAAHKFALTVALPSGRRPVSHFSLHTGWLGASRALGKVKGGGGGESNNCEWLLLLLSSFPVQIKVGEAAEAKRQSASGLGWETNRLQVGPNAAAAAAD